MHQVEIFESSKPKILKENINEWLIKNQRHDETFKFVDLSIEYQSCWDNYIAVLVYKTKEPESMIF